MPEFRAEVRLPVPPDVALEWHRRPGAFERLTPPWVRVHVEARTGTIEPGDGVALRVRKGPVTFLWRLEHVPPEGGTGFADVQRKGPFASWRHDHLFRAAAGGAVLEDRVFFALPGALAAAHGIVARDLARLFAFRHRVTQEDLAAHARAGARTPLTVLVSGASGLVGWALGAVLGGAGHRLVRLVRRTPRAPDEAFWDPARGLGDPGALPRIDAIVHLAGESIAGGVWTAERMRRIRESRVVGTRVLAEAAAALEPRPAAFLSASAIGVYGSRGDEVLDEDSASGTGFLADVGREWEGSVAPAAAAGIRTVALRLGLVLSPRGGLLGKMLPAFRAGLGGPLGDGSQWMSWVSLDDVVFSILHALHRPEVAGAVNVVAPHPVRNAEFARTLARVLGRPAPLRVPAAILRAVSREMADEAFLSSQRVVAKRLPEAAFAFRDTDLETCLRHGLGR